MQTATLEPTPTLPPSFAIEGEIGRALPRKIVYDPQGEQMAVVDAYNRLLLANALDYSTSAVLYERGNYGDVAFSRDGRWLAVLTETSVDLWDTQSFALAASMTRELGTVLSLNGPIDFSSDNQMMLFYGVYPAPAAMRRTENDTITYPWVWHLPAARGEGESTLPNGVIAQQMFDYPNGFVFTPDDKIVAALPSRLQVLDAFTLDALYEIPMERFAQDPVTIWRSLSDERVYVRSTSGSLWQVDTTRQALVDFPLNTALNQGDLQLIGALEVSSIAQVIGAEADRGINPLINQLLPNYRDVNSYGSRPLTITLVDLLLPPASTPDAVQALLFVYDENASEGRFVLTSGYAQQFVLSPDANELLMRVSEGEEYVIAYDLASGTENNRLLPALRGIGGYNRQAKNRVLAYSADGADVISDFQRVDRASFVLEAEDLRYSRVFERFFFSDDSETVVTLSGSEWRVWDVHTGEVLRREVLTLNGSIIATSRDGYRFLTQYDQDAGTVLEVIDLNDNSRVSTLVTTLPATGIEGIYPNEGWTKFLVVYGVNSYGMYAPGNELGLYDAVDGQQWLISGNDLPPNGARQYGWVDAETVFVHGEGTLSSQPERIFGVDYAPNGLPACIVNAFPNDTATFLRLWERLLYYLSPQRLHELSLRVCEAVPATAREVEVLLERTPVQQQLLQAGLPSGDIPRCLLDRYPDQIDEYSAVWQAMIVDLNPQQTEELAVLLCEGIGPIPATAVADPYVNLTMFIDAETGVRSSGAYQPVERTSILMGPIYERFELTEGRPLGNAILSPDRQFVAASNLPGELVVYRLLVTYQDLVSPVTATAESARATANLIYPLPTLTPTPDLIGTARPTLTPTPEQTRYPRPQDEAYSGPQVVSMCPSEQLSSPLTSSAPPSGRLYATFSDGPVWVVEVEDGQRREAPEVIQCTRGVDCQFSPDGRWILAETYDLVYVVRPDNTDTRVLWDLRTPDPPTPIPQNLYWAGPDVLEWEGMIPVTSTPDIIHYEPGYVRDVLNVFPDPRPWVPVIRINEIPANFVSRQPGGLWAVATISYNTGTGQGIKYYLYHTETGEAMIFAQGVYESIQVAWHPLGDRLFFTIYENNGWNPETYQVVLPERTAQHVETGVQSGRWSHDGRYRVYSTGQRDNPVGVFDSLTGETRNFCLPETGAREYNGPFDWSPDNRYVALLAPLPADELDPGVGSHTLILDIETGEVMDLTTGVLDLIAWVEDPGAYGDGAVATPTASPSPMP